MRRLYKIFLLLLRQLKSLNLSSPPFRKGGMGGFDKFMYLNAVVIIVVLCVGVTMANSKDIKDGNKVISGSYLEAWNVCYFDFIEIETLSKEEKKLIHYDVEFSEDDESFIIELIPKLLSEEEAKKLNVMVIGRNAKYWIDKKSLKIKRRTFYKS